MVTDGLLAFFASSWGLRTSSDAVDLGGSASLNVLLDDGSSRFVGRVYRSHVSTRRVEELQAIRRHLATFGLPFVTPVPTVRGAGFAMLDEQVVEVEPFVPSDARMNDLDRVRRALPLLGQIHRSLAALRSSSPPQPSFANYLSADAMTTATASGTARIRSWRPTRAELSLADRADSLAEVLARASAAIPAVPVQLVHGDFWDDNVLFAGDDVALVADLDFLGRRPRVDDLALTLYFTCQDILDVTTRPDVLADLVSRYESGLGEPLSPDERLHLPLALARQPLWSIGVWVAQLDDERTARAHLAATATAIRWATEVADRRHAIQEQLAAPIS